MGFRGIHRKFVDFSFDWFEGRGHADYRHRRESHFGCNWISSLGAAYYCVSGMSALSVFKMGSTTA